MKYVTFKYSTKVNGQHHHVFHLAGTDLINLLSSCFSLSCDTRCECDCEMYYLIVTLVAVGIDL